MEVVIYSILLTYKVFTVCQLAPSMVGVRLRHACVKAYPLVIELKDFTPESQFVSYCVSLLYIGLYMYMCMCIYVDVCM